MSVDLTAGKASILRLDQTGAAMYPTMPLATVTGFYFSTRLVFGLLAARVFFRDPQDGVAASLALNYLLVVAALFTVMGPAKRTLRSLLHLPCMRWGIIFFGLSGISLLWSVTSSMAAAAAFWCAMVADTAIVFLLLRDTPVDTVVNSLMRGYIWGSCAVAVLAWMLPAQSDLRLGDEELLGPNQIGWVCAFAFFFAQYLMRKKSGNWTVEAILLAVTLLRSLSKTSIIAFLVGQAYILARDSSVKRSTKLWITAGVLLTLVLFSSLLENYYTVYTNAGNQSETLTGRLGIWAYIATEAIDKPWFGHGFHSVWKVIPPFDQGFEARHAHNELLQQFYAYGFIGVFTVGAIYGSLYRQLRRLTDAPLRTFFLGMLLFVLVRGLADTEAFDLSLPIWCVVMIGALIEQSRRKSEVTA
jgi:exopolysaccharide production protein ExoQ